MQGVGVRNYLLHANHLWGSLDELDHFEPGRRVHVLEMGAPRPFLGQLGLNSPNIAQRHALT